MRQMNYPFLPSGQKGGAIVVTGDGEWVLNGCSREGPLAMGTNPYTQYRFANQNFLQNILDFLNDESGVMQSRGKVFVLRALDPKKLEAQKTMWQYINIAGPLLLLLLAGGIISWQRRRKFATPVTSA